MISPTNILVPQIIAPGLQIGVGPGLVWFGSSSIRYQEAYVGLFAQSTNYVYLNFGNGLIQVSTSGFPSNVFPIATAVTSNIGVLSLQDNRPDLVSGVGGGGGSGPTFDDSEVPAGLINGVNNAFTLANNPVPPGSLQLFLNGVLLQQNLDYTVSNFTVTFVTAPSTGDKLLAFYRSSGGSGGPNFSDGEIPSGLINGVNSAFSLANTPNPALSLLLYLNGLLQQQGTDYTLSNNIITFTTPPSTGDTLEAFYRH